MSFRQGARQFFERRGAPTPPLPYDAAEVEYLEGVSGGYIVLPWAFANTDRCELDAQFTDLSRQCYNGGWYIFSSIDRIDFAAVEGSSFRINYGPGNNVKSADTQRHLFILDALANNCSIDAVSYSLPGTHVDVPSDSAYIGILGRLNVNRGLLPSGQPNIQGIGCRVFSCKIYRNNVLSMDLIPVRFTNEQGESEGAMYDRVSGQLFRNAGTGAFTIGPDKS